MKVAVDREALVSKVEAHLHVIEEQVSEQQQAYDRALPEILDEMASFIRDLGIRIGEGNFNPLEDELEEREATFRFLGTKVTLSFYVSSAPPKPDTYQLVRARRQLEALRNSTQKSFNIDSRDELWRYLDSPEER